MFSFNNISVKIKRWRNNFKSFSSEVDATSFFLSFKENLLDNAFTIFIFADLFQRSKKNFFDSEQNLNITFFLFIKANMPSFVTVKGLI